MIDNVRVYNVALTAAQIQTDESDPGERHRSGHDAAVAARHADRDRRLERRDRSLLGRLDRQRRRHRLRRRALRRAPAAPTSPRSRPRPAPRYKDTERQRLRRATATGSARSTPPATSALTPTPSPRRTGLFVTPRQYAITPGMTEQYTATVPGGSPAVTWSVDGIARRQRDRRNDLDGRPLHRSQRGRPAHDHRDERELHGHRDGLCHQLPGHVHRPQRQSPHGREPRTRRS